MDMYRQLTDGEVETATIVYERYTPSLVIRDMQNFKNEIIFYLPNWQKLESADKDVGKFHPHWW